MSRVLTVIYIIFCFEMGVFLFVLPWVSAIAMNYFVRGAVSGVGLADIWLAIYEVWRLRRQLGLVQSHPAR